jgi:hypothetical protein
LLEETKSLTSKAAMPVFQVHVRGFIICPLLRGLMRPILRRMRFAGFHPLGVVCHFRRVVTGC